MLGKLLEFGCEDVVFVPVIRVAGLVVLKLVLNAVDLRKTVGSERLGLFEGGVENGVRQGRQRRLFQCLGQQQRKERAGNVYSGHLHGIPGGGRGKSGGQSFQR